MASGAFAPAGLVRRGRGRLILEIDVGKLLAVEQAAAQDRSLASYISQLIVADAEKKRP